jgi:hypothetical protein
MAHVISKQAGYEVMEINARYLVHLTYFVFSESSVPVMPVLHK